MSISIFAIRAGGRVTWWACYLTLCYRLTEREHIKHLNCILKIISNFKSHVLIFLTGKRKEKMNPEVNCYQI